MQDEVVQDEHARPRHGELPDRRVVAVVAHLVERQAPVLSGPRGLDRPEARRDLGVERQIRQLQHPHVGALGEVRQELETVVRDAGAHRRQRREIVEAQHARHSIDSQQPGRFLA